MKEAFTFLGIALLAMAAGCTTKSQARLKAQQAFVSGQQQAIAQQQHLQAIGNNVQISGEVRNQLLEWRDGLTLSQAIVEAEYTGSRDPVEIVIFRGGQIIAIKPRDLLRGKDQWLQPGDRIEVRR